MNVRGIIALLRNHYIVKGLDLGPLVTVTCNLLRKNHFASSIFSKVPNSVFLLLLLTFFQLDVGEETYQVGGNGLRDTDECTRLEVLLSKDETGRHHPMPV